MPRFLPEEEWRPIGVDEIEPNADAVVRSAASTLVVAGPGAGKTELLAQKANFLLETGRCPPQRRILALSFKRDAAKNLGDRVRERCGEDAGRFDSFTLDAFAKQTVDRFMAALPADWRPDPAYHVRTGSIRPEDAEEWLLGARLPEGSKRPAIRTWRRPRVKRALETVMHGEELPYDGASVHELVREWGTQWWREQLALPPGGPSLSFAMLNRLAALLLRLNPKIGTALRLTYSDVFLDEFQDTSASQWDLVRSAFLGSDTVLTAVGDSKQRIMVWAGAKVDIFDVFENEFTAERVDLVRNYRSAPELVRMQHVIAQAVEAGTTEPESACTWEGTGACQILEFRSPEQEAAHLADMIAGELATGERTPRDYGVLVRQRVPQMITQLQEELGARGILLRDESRLQDLRAEPISNIVLPALRLATRTRDAEAWDKLVSHVAALSGLDLERDEREIEQMAVRHKACTTDHLAKGVGLADLPQLLIDVLGEGRYRSMHRQYVNGDYLNTVATQLGEALDTSMTSVGEAALVPDDIAGLGVMPAMTIHKSKGLEFETVIFLGLEDGQWWAFRNEPEEEKRSFFVAFSRAIGRVLFTCADERDDARYGRKRQTRNDIDALYTVLAQAGVPTVDCR